MFIHVGDLLFIALGVHSDSLKLLSAECWQDEWLLRLCLMMKLLFAVNMVSLGIM